MNYTRILNQRLKKAGRDYRKGQETEKRELLFREIREVREEAEETGSFLPWSEAAERLGWSREEEGLICVLWSARGEELTRQEFERLYRELWEEELLTEELPAWYLPLPDGIGLSPVVTGWLEERLPELPGRGGASTSGGEKGLRSGNAAEGGRRTLYAGRTAAGVRSGKTVPLYRRGTGKRKNLCHGTDGPPSGHEPPSGGRGYVPGHGPGAEYLCSLRPALRRFFLYRPGRRAAEGAAASDGGLLFLLRYHPGQKTEPDRGSGSRGGDPDFGTARSEPEASDGGGGTGGS